MKINKISLLIIAAFLCLNTPLKAEVQSLPAIKNRRAASVRIYDFQKLYKDLGYTQAYFGATDSELEALETYTTTEDSFYREINDYLRYYPGPYTYYGLTPDQAKELVSKLDSLFGRIPVLPYDLVLFRGMKLKFRADKPYAVNDEFTDKAYVSTSPSLKVAEKFALDKDHEADGLEQALFIIYANKPGAKGLLIPSHEEEVILNRGSRFRIMAAKKIRPDYSIYLAQLCAAPCETSVRFDIRSFWERFVLRYSGR